MDINSVWDIRCVNGIRDGLYRIISFYSELNICVVFYLAQQVRSLNMPVNILISDLEQSIFEGKTKSVSFSIPAFQIMAEEQIPEEIREKRDAHFDLIKPLVDDPIFLLELGGCKRCSRVANYAAAQKTYTTKVYRILNKYWYYGQERNALLPSWANCGGRGKARISGSARRGAPVQHSPFMMMKSFYRNVTEQDKVIFIKGVKKYGKKNEKWSISALYRSIIADFYCNGVGDFGNEDSNERIPSERAFRYWINKLIKPEHVIERQTSERDFMLRKRALRGSATDHTLVPGSCFELDATVLDVHIVSSFNRRWVLGRPVLYLVVDKESRMIVGLHVSMEYASWRAGRQALVNSFTSKKQYCARFGVSIEEEDWPCHHIPQKLLCDRGEFICRKPEEIVVPLIGNLSIAPSWRADVKGIVERRFKIINDELIHGLMGTTKGRHYIRGDKDPRKNACYTLDDITKLLIREVLEHNDSIKESLIKQSKLLPENSIIPTPRNYWNIHLKLHRHSLRYADEVEIRAKLLPCRWVSMTARGIRLNDDMYYEGDHEEFEAMKVIARHSGRIRLEARIDQDNSSFIHVKVGEEETFTRCTLMKMSSNYNDQHTADIELIMAWRKNVTSGPRMSAGSADRKKSQMNTINEIENNFNRRKNGSRLECRPENIRNNRANAVNFQRNGFSSVIPDNPREDNGPVQLDGVRSQSEMVSILKRRR